jgi:hypothetical protein
LKGNGCGTDAAMLLFHARGSNFPKAVGSGRHDKALTSLIWNDECLQSSLRFFSSVIGKSKDAATIDVRAGAGANAAAALLASPEIRAGEGTRVLEMSVHVRDGSCRLGEKTLVGDSRVIALLPGVACGKVSPSMSGAAPSYLLIR